MKNLLIYKILAELINTCNRIIHKICKYIIKLIRVIKDHYYDKKLGIDTSESYFCSSNDSASLYKDMHIHRPTPYDTLRLVVDYLKLKQDDIFVDFGCGKGRAVFFVAMQRLKKVIGVELDKRLVDIAGENLKNVKINNTPIEIVNADAAVFNIKDANIFFMFNPFGPKTVKKVIDNIKQSLTANPREIRIVYYNPDYKYLLDTEDWLVPDRKIEDEEVSIWSNKDL
jgi:cyclopropane fatty-acyl-phospholipid synthase-like methyltransferase